MKTYILRDPQTVESQTRRATPRGAARFLAGAFPGQPERLPAISRGLSAAIPPDLGIQESHPESGASRGRFGRTAAVSQRPAAARAHWRGRANELARLEGLAVLRLIPRGAGHSRGPLRAQAISG